MNILIILIVGLLFCLSQKDIISFSSRNMGGSQLAGTWHERDGCEMVGSGIFSGLFASSKMIFTISKSSLLESLLIRWLIKFWTPARNSFPFQLNIVSSSLRFSITLAIYFF